MKKINVLIADDEKIVRDGLSKYVDWDEYDMQVIGTADDGQAALHIITNSTVDLVITDIHMPIVDGMTLISRLEKIKNSPLVILISGFRDFSYAQTAIRSGIVQDYILKPLDFDQLDIILTKVRDRILVEQSSVQFPVLNEEEWRVFTSTRAAAIVESQNEIVDQIENGNLDRAIEIFDNAIELCRRKGFSHNFLSRYCIELTINICEMALENEGSIDLLGHDPVREISKRNTDTDVFKYVREMIIKAKTAIGQTADNNMSPIIKAVLSLINSNYSDSTLCLNNIADQYNTSASYLSNKFKDEVGINYAKYLNGLRIKRAKEYLNDASLKVFMISDKVGYDDVRYFSRIFRKSTGYTPTEYQNKVAKFTLSK